MQTLNTFFGTQKESQGWVNSITESQEFTQAKQLISRELTGFQVPPSFYELMIVKLCEILQSEHKKDIERLLWHSVGDKYYFSKKMNELRIPEQIGDTEIFVQTHMTSSQAIKLAYSIVSFFGYSEDDFSVSSENK